MKRYDMRYTAYDNRDLFRKARESIYSIEAEVMHLLPGGRREGREWIALNPTRADHGFGSFRINLTTGKWADFATHDAGNDIVSLLAYLRGVSQYEAALEILHKRSNYYRFSLQTLKPANTRLGCDHNRKHKTLHIKNTIDRIWRRCTRVASSPVEDYLKSRGITNFIPHSIRYHPRLYHSPTQMFYPAMVAIIFRWRDKASLGLHRTYLKANNKNARQGIDSDNEDNSNDNTGNSSIGKADIFPNKMMLGGNKGGAVMLAHPEKGKPLVIAEGIETALSVFVATQYPTWAALSASGMINVEVPPIDITPEIIIAADHDPAGISAANKLADKLLKQGYKVKIALPPTFGTDFNDLLLEEEKVADQDEDINEASNPKKGSEGKL